MRAMHEKSPVFLGSRYWELYGCTRVECKFEYFLLFYVSTKVDLRERRGGVSIRGVDSTASSALL